MSQLPLFRMAAKPQRDRQTSVRLGPNQAAVLARLQRYGSVRVREAGRIVYLNRGHTDPGRVPADWIETAGLRVLVSLRRRGLVRSSRDGRWFLRKGALA